MAATVHAGLDDILRVEDAAANKQPVSNVSSNASTASARLFNKSPNAKPKKRKSAGILKQLSTSSYKSTAFASSSGGFNVDFEMKKRISESEGNIEKRVSQEEEENNANATSVTRKRRGKLNKQYSNLFPCPMVKTLDLDSPEGSMSSLGIVSGLNYSSVPFASSTSYTLAAARVRGSASAVAHRRAFQHSQRTRSVQSPTSSYAVATNCFLQPPSAMGTPQTCSSCGSSSGRPQSAMSSWPQRQSSLPAYTVTYLSTSPDSRSPRSPPGSGASRSPRSPPGSRSPRPPPLQTAKSLHARTHKLKRQVTICEDSVSIPDSALVLSRQCSYSDSVTMLRRPSSAQATTMVLPQPPLQHQPSTSPPPSQMHPPRSSLTPSPQPTFLQPSAAVPQQQQVPSRPRTPDMRHRMEQTLPRQESSFTQEEINRYVRYNCILGKPDNDNRKRCFLEKEKENRTHN